ncbi:MAG: hypothetical protein V4808_06175 [Pseudomonadota bacterium]
MNTGILSQLYAHQTDVKAAMAETQALFTAEPIDMFAAANARWKLTRLLTGYQMFKHQRIFDPLIRGGSVEDARVACQMKIDCVAMGENFRIYLARWTASGIEGREAEYRRDAAGMIAMLHRHILRERSGIEALLAPEKRAA